MQKKGFTPLEIYRRLRPWWHSNTYLAVEKQDTQCGIISKRGFTLLELLIVIGILAILATATVLVLNPAELLKQARDSQRISDLKVLNKAISLYITSVAAPNMASSSNSLCKSGGGTYSCYSDRNATLSATCGGRFSALAANPITSTNRQVNGGGWLPVDFTGIAGGSPLPQLPTDPSNSASLFYAYACNMGTASGTYVITGAFESQKFTTGTTNPAATDGGSSTIVYEVGTNPSLNGVGSGM
jgi:prepilin-type N-terminal cleavage/methylation domain-containing protein